ncbi:MAG: sulfotransferase family protein [Carbonactinosporaceae bacterium]
MFKVQRTPRLVRSPVFLLSAGRSGSTLLRSVLDTHSQIHSPLQLVLTELEVTFPRFRVEVSFGTLGLDVEELEYILWDRVLDRELKRSGKTVLVDNAPALLFQWRRLAECWPEARYIFLIRHPANIVASAEENSGPRGKDRAWCLQLTDSFLRILHLLHAAREELPGLTVRYEDLTADPAQTCAAICEFLGLEWEPTMLDYSAVDHGQAVGSGDFSENLRSGRIRANRQVPTEKDVPLPLRAIARNLGYTAPAEVPSVRPG